MPQYEIKVNPLNKMGIPVLFNIYEPDKRKERIGYALVFTNTTTEEAMLWDIQVDSNYRRQGVATALIEGIKEVHTNIITGNRTPEGEFMCLANGFEWEKTEGGNSCLVWRKEEKDATKKGIIEESS